MAEVAESFHYACGRLWFFPAYVLERPHIQYTLICDCARIYTVVRGLVELRNKPS
jgi:hypothetical protein